MRIMTVFYTFFSQVVFWHQTQHTNNYQSSEWTKVSLLPWEFYRWIVKFIVYTETVNGDLRRLSRKYAIVHLTGANSQRVDRKWSHNTSRSFVLHWFNAPWKRRSYAACDHVKPHGANMAYRPSCIGSMAYLQLTRLKWPIKIDLRRPVLYFMRKNIT